ncbi:fibrillarin-like rRNA/tRNA 2'-O-methyltransferase [Candidatus Woesearchaeota archaeon]|nr:MAG: fibrillarin-like rRNA/tRNA 2'-O-methyltransferase [Candidatus Woesearchaeota archaeon]
MNFIKERSRILTVNLTPGTTFFGEELVRRGKEYRVLDPTRSKLGAALMKGLQQHGILPGKTVLYLGASHGYTPSFVSDLVGNEGFVFCLDFAPRVVRDLVFVCEARTNMAPILASANEPETYAGVVPIVDVVYQDIAQREQVAMFLKNCDRFLRRGGYGLLALKARSIDVAKKPGEIFKRVRKEFEDGEASKRYVLIDYRELHPFEKDHAFYVVKKK